MDIGPIKHDPLLCGVSTETTCPKCRPGWDRMLAREAQYGRMKVIEERMTKAGIDMDDFADAIWMRLQPSLEREVKKIMEMTIRMMLNDLRIIGRIEGTR